MLTLIEPCKPQIILSADTFKVLTLLAITPCHVKLKHFSVIIPSSGEYLQDLPKSS